MLEWFSKHKIIGFSLAIVGAFFVYRAGKGVGAAQQAATQSDNGGYNGPSYIGTSPAVVMPSTDTSSTAASINSSTPLDVASYIQGQIELGRQNANVATTATAQTTNVDLVSAFLDKINPKKFASSQLNFSYNDQGQVTHFDTTKALDPVDAAKQAATTAKANATQRKDLLAAIKQGFTPPDWSKYSGAVQVKQALTDWLAQVDAYKKSGGAVGTNPNPQPVTAQSGAAFSSQAIAV